MVLVGQILIQHLQWTPLTFNNNSQPSIDRSSMTINEDTLFAILFPEDKNMQHNIHHRYSVCIGCW